jgi:STE24 endopeptidase
VRDWCQRTGRIGVVRDALYGGFFAVASWVLTLPLAIYQGYFREHQYEMATQTFGPWFIDQLKGLGVAVIGIGLAVALLYAVIRRAGERWWLWGTAATLGLIVLTTMVAPVWIDPLFNTYKPVSDPVVKAAVLAMAKADGVPVDNVYEFDASQQTTRVSANVSGIFGSAAVRLNDNLMHTSLPEIRAVMGHELGHFVMNHIYKAICEMAIVIFVVFVLSKWAMDRLLARHGAAWGLSGVSDVAGFPLFVAVFTTFMFLATPITNTLVRTQETEADRFGLNLAREPHGEAEVDLKLTEYRKPDPGPIEEFMFFDHPSTRFRIHDAMRWREAMGTE